MSQVFSFSGMMKRKGILLGYNFLSLHITLNIMFGPIYLNLDLGLRNCPYYTILGDSKD